MSTVISPTVGRVVWYFPDRNDRIIRNGDQPLAAMIACVCTDKFVHLGVLDANGHSENRTGVPLIQDGETRPVSMGYCTWMPYQVGQAKKETLPLSPPAIDPRIEDPAPIPMKQITPSNI